MIEELIINGTLFCYGVWDWTVFLCYLVKISQFYRKTGKENIEESTARRIKFVVYKMAFLTLIIEIMALFVVMGYDRIQDPNVNWIVRLILNIFIMEGMMIVILRLKGEIHWKCWRKCM